jgi:hypothetical protein
MSNLNSISKYEFKAVLKILITLVDENEEYYREIKLNLKYFDSFSEFCSLLCRNLELSSPSNYIFKILYENSWFNLIDLKSFYFFVSNNLIFDQNPHIKIEKSKTDEDFKFNIKGEKEGDSARPSMKIYESWINPEVFCAFCGYSSKDSHRLQRLGPFYGPVTHGGRKYFFHEMCVIWTPKVFLDDYGKLQNVVKEIKRAKQLRCSYCNEKGAGLGCLYESCQKNYHILCAKSDGSSLNNKKYQILCKDHKNKMKFEESDKFKDNFVEPQVDEICYECKSLLADREDDDILIFCDNCNLPIHRYCNKPAVVVLPPEDEEFYCYICVNSINLTTTKQNI